MVGLRRVEFQVKKPKTLSVQFATRFIFKQHPSHANGNKFYNEHLSAFMSLTQPIFPITEKILKLFKKDIRIKLFKTKPNKKKKKSKNLKYLSSYSIKLMLNYFLNKTKSKIKL